MDEQARKRPYYDVFDERKSRSDGETDDRQRRSDKKHDHAEDLRRHLLKKLGNEQVSTRDQSRSSEKIRHVESHDRRHESSDRSRSDHDRHRQP